MLITCLPALIYFITSGKSSGLAKSAYASSITNQHFSGSASTKSSNVSLSITEPVGLFGLQIHTIFVLSVSFSLKSFNSIV